MTPWIWAVIAIVLNILVFLIIFMAIWMGFRMGRKTIDKPEPPIIATKTARMTEEDPWYEPMHGSPQPSISTVEEK